MCGITGIVNLVGEEPIEEGILRRMLGAIRHRGPDQFGLYLDRKVGLGSARLSILDLADGQQPIANEDESLWIVFNGEVFNHVELRAELEGRGHRFSTRTDTEVILHLYEELGPECLSRLNGDFAIAIWNVRDESLFLARDRVGVRPLFYTRAGGQFLFASEIKSLLVDRRVTAQIDPTALDQIFTFWSTLSPRTVFRNIFEIPPGQYLVARRGEFQIRSYWELDFQPAVSDESGSVSARRVGELIEELQSLLTDATRIRLRADVPVGAYLSGGLDSSTIASIVRNLGGHHLDTFSIAFDDADFDESAFQRRMAEFLGTRHQVVQASHADIGRVFPDVIWHTETPIMRTSPAPMFLLSRLVHERRYKVVLTGEGADEFFGGYDIFKEAKVRQFWARQPLSTRRPLLLQRLYPDIGRLARSGGSYLTAFFKEELTNVEAPWYSHFIRWRNNRRSCRFFSEAVADDATRGAREFLDRISFPARGSHWGLLERAQYLEVSIFLSQYLLSAQGDRVAMAHSVEGRFPFLDPRVIEFASRLPSNLKLRGLTEKYLLRKAARPWLPPAVWQRPKRPYRAPIQRCFFHSAAPNYVDEVLSDSCLREAGLFRPEAVRQLTRRAAERTPLSETDDMALAGIISSQLTHTQFSKALHQIEPINERDDLKVCRGAAVGAAA